MYQQDHSPEEELAMSAEFPEFSVAAKVMEEAGERLQLASLPLQKSVAECTVNCFKGIDMNEVMRSARGAASGKSASWFSGSSSSSVVGSSSSSSLAANVSRCVEKCTEPVANFEQMIEEERNELIKGSVECMQRCKENDNDCYRNCVGNTMNQENVNSMIDRVLNRMRGLF